MDTDETTDSSSNPNSPAMNMASTETPTPEKTVDEGIADSRAEMAGLNVLERIAFVRNKTAEHTRIGLILSEECRLKMKEHRGSVETLLRKTKSHFNELNTLLYYINGAMKRTTEIQNELQNHLNMHNDVYQKIKTRDGHLDFVLKLLDVTATDLSDTWNVLDEKIRNLETENKNLRERNYKLKGNFFRKRGAEEDSKSLNDVEFVSYYRRSKKPKVDVEVFAGASSGFAGIVSPFKNVEIFAPSSSPPGITNVDASFIGLSKPDSVASEFKPDIEDVKLFELKTPAKGWMDLDKKLDDEIRTELDDRQRELFEELQRQQEKDEHLRAIGLTRASLEEIPVSTTTQSASTITTTTVIATTTLPSSNVTTVTTAINTTATSIATTTSSTPSKTAVAVGETPLTDSEYERRASKELERQRQISAEIAKKKEIAAKRDSAERESRRKSAERRREEEVDRLPPQTLHARRVSDGFEIQYRTANLMKFKERVPCYLDSDWPQLSTTTLQELLPSPFCIRLIYGKGLKRNGTMDTIHVDPFCLRSHITYQMLDGAKRRKLGAPVTLQLSWGRCRKFTCNSYVDVEFYDPPTSKMVFPVRLCVVDDPGYDKNRITLGFDFISQFIHSKKGAFDAGDILLGDRQGYWWATTYQRKVRHN